MFFVIKQEFFNQISKKSVFDKKVLYPGSPCIQINTVSVIESVQAL